MQHFLSFWASYSITWPRCKRSFVSNNWCLVWTGSAFPQSFLSCKQWRWEKILCRYSGARSFMVLYIITYIISTNRDRKPTTQCTWKEFSSTNVNQKDSSETIERIFFGECESKRWFRSYRKNSRGNRTLITPINCRKKGGNIKVIKLGFSGALKMANEERELSVSAQCKLGGWDSLRLFVSFVEERASPNRGWREGGLSSSKDDLVITLAARFCNFWSLSLK